MSNMDDYEYKNGFLLLEDGSIFKGKSLGDKGFVKAELCFNTTLFGYQETISDPSYAEQIITFSMPHVGNIGVNDFDSESDKIYAKGVIFNNYIENYSHHQGQISLEKWLVKNKVLALTDVDTRAIIKKLRNKGTMDACIVALDNPISQDDIKKAQDILKNGTSINEKELAIEISTKKEFLYDPKINNKVNNTAKNKEKSKEASKVKSKINNNGENIVLIDFGYKDNIANILHNQGFNVHILPAKSDYATIKKYDPVGVILSNGAGNPNMIIPHVKDSILELVKNEIPLLAICLGHQLLALSLECKVEKLPYGHHGVNHPVKNLETNKIEITSQNHMYAVSQNLSQDVEVTHINLFDNTIEGIRIKNKPIISLQYHPESSAGPHDSIYNFNDFYQLIRKYNNTKEQANA